MPSPEAGEKKKKKKKKSELKAELKAELARLKKENQALSSSKHEEPPLPVPTKEEPPKKKRKTAANKEEVTKSSLATVYVGGLPYSETKESISDHFSRCGSVASVEMKGFDDDETRFCGIAFVTFREGSSVEKCLENMDNTEYGERTLKIRRYKERRPPPERVGDSTTIYAGNMPFDATREEVENFFSEQGCDVVNIRYHTDPDTKEFRGFCHVEFSDDKSLQIALNGIKSRFRGRALRIMNSVTAKKNPNSS